MRVIVYKTEHDRKVNDWENRKTDALMIFAIPIEGPPEGRGDRFLIFESRHADQSTRRIEEVVKAHFSGKTIDFRVCSYPRFCPFLFVSTFLRFLGSACGFNGP